MLSPGSTLQHYTLERLVGVGGMSRVWSAHDTRTGARVALKLLRPRESTPEWARERLLREAHATRAVTHPAIVPVLEILEHEGAPVLAMELLEGETLRALLEREQKLDLARAAETLLPVAEALAQAHRVGIVHRDLKPENIFIQSAAGTGDGPSVRIRLLDFGVARFYEPPPGSEHTPITGIDVLLGTVYYMSPEQAVRPAESDQRVDVWALGVTLYEVLSGCRPIDGDTPAETLRHLLIGGVTPLAVLAPALPLDVTTLVASMLVRSPDRRARNLESTLETLRRHAPHRLESETYCPPTAI
jgi:serine/threonine protein kinase